MNKNRLLNKKKWITPLFISLGIIMGVINAINPSPAKLLVCVIFALISLFTSHIAWEGKTKRIFIFLLLIAFSLWLFNVLSVFAQEGENPLRLVTLLYLLYAVIVSFIFSYDKFTLLPLKVIFYLIAFYFYYKCIILGILPDEIFMFSSGGMMASILFSIAIPIQFFDYKWNERVSIAPAIVILIISVLSISRTALICSLLYVLIILLAISFGNKRLKIFGLLFFILVSFLAYKWVVQSWDEISALDIYSKFEYMGMDSSSREDIWKTYLNELDFITFFIGRNVDKTHKILGFANTHNSFIQLHSQIGVFFFVFIVYFIKACWFYIKNDIFVFGLILVLVLRCSFDTLFFFNIYDFAIIVFLISYYRHKKVKLQNIRVSLL